MTRIRLALCQLNTVVGDLEGNAERITAYAARAEEAGADLAMFPELALCGYPPEDLLLKSAFVADNLAWTEKLVASSGPTVMVFGFVDAGLDLYNAAMVCTNGRRLGVQHKAVLPNYAVFDERRYFTPAQSRPLLYRIAGVTVGVTICEDAWDPSGPVLEEAAGGAELVLSINASPFYAGRQAERARMMATRASDASCTLAYCNLVGGQDELVFDGGSMVFDPDGNLVASARQFEEELLVVDLEVPAVFRKRLMDPRGRATSAPLQVIEVSSVSASPPSRSAAAPLARQLTEVEETYGALVLGIGDYVAKNGFGDVVVGLSGGVDSSLVATLAVDALGSEHVHGVGMPSRFSSEHSLADARELATRLGIDLSVIPIEGAHAAMESMLAPAFGTGPPGLAEENLQSRIRGVILMALSNKLGWLVLTTGNKSETAVGYSTLYGDTAGGFAPVKDVPKTLLYELCRYRNAVEKAPLGPIPESVLTKAPSAELRPDQRDDQSLPPYELLDAVLEGYVEKDLSPEELVAAGYPEVVVARVVSLVDRAEYKRRQSPPGVRVTPKAFGKDRRLPITNRYGGLSR